MSNPTPAMSTAVTPAQAVKSVIMVLKRNLNGELRKIEDSIDRIDPPQDFTQLELSGIPYIRAQLSHMNASVNLAMACCLAISALQVCETGEDADDHVVAQRILAYLGRTLAAELGGEA